MACFYVIHRGVYRGGSRDAACWLPVCLGCVCVCVCLAADMLHVGFPRHDGSAGPSRVPQEGPEGPSDPKGLRVPKDHGGKAADRAHNRSQFVSSFESETTADRAQSRALSGHIPLSRYDHDA